MDRTFKPPVLGTDLPLDGSSFSSLYPPLKVGLVGLYLIYFYGGLYG